MKVLIVRWDHNMHSECSVFIKKYKCRYDCTEIDIIYWEQYNRLLLCKNKQIYKGHLFIESYGREYWKVYQPTLIKNKNWNVKITNVVISWLTFY